jgi:hypothetical protein
VTKGMGCRLLTRTGPGRQSVGRRPTIRELAGCKEVKITTCPDPGLIQHPIAHIYTDLGGNIAFTMLFFSGVPQSGRSGRSIVDKSHGLAFTLVTCHSIPWKMSHLGDAGQRWSDISNGSFFFALLLLSLLFSCYLSYHPGWCFYPVPRIPVGLCPSLYPRTRGRCMDSSV